MEPLIGTQATDLIKDSSSASFAEDVLMASQDVPILVDFWAEWCGPCKSLGPILEKVVRQADGAVKLVKIDIDKNPDLAQQLRIQSVPMVYAFRDGRPVDGFAGALPESQIKQFVQRLTGDSGPSRIEQAIESGLQQLEQGQAEAAAELFTQILRAEPQNPDAIAGLAQACLALDDLEGARAALDSADEEAAKHAAIASARAAIDVKEQAEEAGDLAPLHAAVESNPNDHQSRFDLAGALVAANAREDAVEHLLEIIRRDRHWNEDAARLQLLKLFDAFGQTDPLTIASRRKLSAILFS